MDKIPEPDNPYYDPVVNRLQHLQADLDSARQQSYNMTVEARQEKAKADRLRAVNAKLLAALEGLVAQEETRLHAWKITNTHHLDHAREAIEEARK